MSDVSHVNVQRTSHIQETGTVGSVQSGTLGDHTVTLGTGQNTAARGTSFGERVKQFFTSIKDAFVSLKDMIATKISTAIEERATARAKTRVEGWESANVDLNASRQTAPGQGAKALEGMIEQMNRAKTHLGSDGLHAMAKASVANCKAEAGKVDPPARWQDLALAGLKAELLRAPDFESAQTMIADLEKHFSTCAKAGEPADLVEFGRVISELKDQVMELGSVDRMARRAFDAEIDHELGNLDTFFRGNTEATTSASCVLRNGNKETTHEMLEAFRDVMTDPRNRADVETLNSARNGEYTTAQFEALSRLTTDFLNRAFALDTDGGQAFAQKFNPTVKAFLSDTAEIIAGKNGFDAEHKNEAIRKWFSNGIALRDLGGPAAEIGREVGFGKAAIELATNVLRIVANVQAGAVPTKLSEEVAPLYDAFIKEKAPQFGTFLQHLGMPQAT